MHPILLKYQLPQEFVNFWSFAEPARPYLVHLIVGVVVLSMLAWWSLSEESPGTMRPVGWLAVVALFAALVTAAVLGLHKLRFVQLHTYGVLVAIGFLVGIVLAVREAQRIGEESERILDLAFWLLIAAMVGARAGYVLTHWADYAGDFSSKVPWFQWRIFRLWEGGLLFFGGFLLAGIVCWVFVRFYKIDFWKLADLLIPSVAIGQFFGLVGSLAAGFGYGKASDASWSVLIRGTHRHPTQMYEALGLLFLFLLLLWIRSNKKFHGQAFLWYLILFPVLSFGVEVFQSDACIQGMKQSVDVCRAMVFHRDVFAGVPGVDLLSWSQLFSCVAVAFGFLLLLARSSQDHSKV